MPEGAMTTEVKAGELIPGRREARARVLVAQLSDSDIDRLIKKAQKKAEPLLKLTIFGYS